LIAGPEGQVRVEASWWVGRVGALALFLGVGGAVVAGAPAAWAQDGETSPTGKRSAAAADSGSARPADRAARPPGGGRDTPDRDPVPRAAARPDRDRGAREEIPLSGGPEPADAAEPVARAVAVAAAAARQVPADPVATPPFANSISVDQQLRWEQGVIQGTLNAVSARGLDLEFSVLRRPSLGGKVALAPGSADAFAYLPYVTAVTDPAAAETFSIMVAEVTAFDRFVRSIPRVGLAADPVLTLLHRIPLVSDLLAPLIGSARIVTFRADPFDLTAGRPVAFTYQMPSFDGTLISLNYYPALDVANGLATSAPTVLNGPDLGFPGNTDIYSVWAPSLVEIVPGIPVLRSGASPFPGGYAASTGFNVITWDPRGEWASGGVLQLDSPFFEGRDVASIISWAAGPGNIAQSQVATEDGDPLIGMVGGSYGGGIQLTSAAIDPRIDAIVPGIAWNTLNESLYPDNTFKTVIGSELLLALVATRARINTEIYPAIVTGALFSWLSQSAQALLSSAGPGILSGNITAPSLFLQGTVDILFELDAASTNAELILARDPSIPVKITWFCGGHGVCLLPTADQQAQGQATLSDSLRWLDQYAAGNPAAGADTIANFRWYDQTGQLYSSDLMPFDPAFNNPVPLSYSGQGRPLLLAPLLGGSGPSPASVPPAPATLFSTAFALAGAGPAVNAVNVPVAPPVGTRIAGAPSLSFSYRGLGTSRAVYAQLVDDATGQVLGNIVNPVPVVLDGRERTAEIDLADIAYTVYGAADSMTLQITSSALPYADLTTWGAIDIGAVEVRLPTVAAP
jgi:ABC-2 type transport system ATP-binding protein